MVISLNLAVHKRKNRVAFAECDRDFVEILFSFLTLPLGTIVRLLDKDSGLGLLDNLYKSIENLGAEYFETESCKSMLLQPRSSAEKQCENLAINVDDLNPRRLFRCDNWDCFTKKHLHYSSVAGVQCPCGKIMDKNNLNWAKKGKGNDGVFVKCSTRFIITDDLHVRVVPSVVPSVSFLQGIGIRDPSKLEDIEIQINKSQVLSLLKRSLHSKTPLTDTFLTQKTNICLKYWRNVCAAKTKILGTNVDIKCEGKVSMKEQFYDANEGNDIKVKIIQSKSSDKALLESENNFPDLIFSFLTFPLGCALSLLGERYSSLTRGSIHNLYNSVADLKDDNKQAIIPAAIEDMLLNPKLPPYFGCSSQTLMVKEMQTINMVISSCKTCKSSCSHNLPKVSLTELNPKIAEASSKYGGGFARSSSKFLTYSDMKIKPMSTIAVIPLMKDLGLSSLRHLREKEFTIGEEEALNLLVACLTSTNKSSFLNFLNLEH